MSKLKLNVNQVLKKLLPGIKRNVLLKEYTTFKIGGPAQFFYEAKTETDLIKAVLIAQKLKLPFFILGNGSNLLVSDKGYRGLIIKIKNQKLKIKKTKEKSKIIEGGAGVLLNQLVFFAIRNNLTNIEWAVGIPGTIGGAIYGNAGAFNKSMADITKTVTVLDIKKNKILKIKNQDCQFAYRNSLFKKKNQNLIILSAELELKKGNKKEIKEKIKNYLHYRTTTQPLNFPSAGSIFLNPPQQSAAYLIEQCGLKGKRIGQAKVSEKHANFILNLGRARASEVKKLINLIKREVKKKFKINLQEEIIFLGF